MSSQMGTLIAVPAAVRQDPRVRVPAAPARVREAVAQADIVERLWGGDRSRVAAVHYRRTRR